ncbi:hypothetical protein ACWEOE_38510 [Amycolatopsis sp. NPDC004368]
MAALRMHRVPAATRRARRSRRQARRCGAEAYGDQLATTMTDGTFLRRHDEYFPGEPHPDQMFTSWPQLRDQIRKGS